MLFQQPASRRTMLNRLALGFGGLAFNALLQSDSIGEPTKSAGLPPGQPHFAPRAKNVVFLFMQGGVSHVDTFDPKPELDKYDGREPPFQRARVKFAKRGNLLKSPWKFRPTGESGLPMSSLWQHLPKVADELCMIHSVCDTNVAHGGATMKLFTGSDLSVRPSLGSWISYGLGTENADLPSYINICPSSLHGGVNNWGAAFLPAIHQGVPLGTPGYPSAPVSTARFKYMNPSADIRLERLQIDLMQKLAAEQSDTNAELNARLQSFELAFRMQMAAPKALDLSSESKSTQQLYGIGSEPTDDFGRQCLLARRLVERGVRFVQVNHAGSLKSQGIPTNEQWDQHSYLEKGHAVNAAQVDLPITGFLQDLKARGLLDETLVIWAGEFGRTPTSQAGGGKNIGRDHHTDGFTIWMAGGGVKGGIRYGATDEFGYYTIQDRMTLHDMHATILHLLGLDHTHLTWHYASRDFRLTDVYGNVAHDIIA
ncbi:MAG: DUF1501 domain-containing protein [Planctomycetes bacterium]|nr:DUF1501 domain-containing protein [Planctomycetota bacterium]